MSLVLIAGGMRFVYPQRLAVEHFDEGVYASNIWFGDQPAGVYPLQHLYAPPLLPALIEWGFVFLGPSNAGAMWPNQLAGTITVLLLWRLGRTWFGPVAGLTAATLCALSDVHVVLSRSALTDVLLGTWWVAALLALRKACDSGRWTHAVGAGILVGTAWYTKYNGWMPLGIALAAVLARGLCCRGIWPQTRRSLISCLMAMVVAFAFWSPWLWALQAKGGYASVMANHRQYIVGFSGWWPSFNRQWNQLSVLAGTLTCCVLGIAYLIMCFAALQRAKKAELAWVPETECCDPEVGPPPVPFWSLPNATWLTTFFWIMLIALPVASQVGLAVQSLILWFLWSRYRANTEAMIRCDNLGYWILVVWFLGMLAATPLYLPYLRLTLPWLLATCCGVGLALQLAWVSVRNVTNTCHSYQSLKRFAVGAVLAYLVSLAVIAPVWYRRSQSARNLPVRTVPLTDHASFLRGAQKLAAVVNAAARSDDGAVVPSVVYVFAEPGLLFQLRNEGLANVAPVGSLEFVHQQASGPQLKVYLATGVHAFADRQFNEQFVAVKHQLKQAGAWSWQLSPLVALDQPDCDTLRLGVGDRDSSGIVLYEVVAP